MSRIHWRKVVKLAAKEFACFLMATDEIKRTITLEAMLGCRNPEEEPIDRVYFGWHAVYSMPEEDENLVQNELLSGSCCKLGQWKNNDLSKEEIGIINEHMAELLTDWQNKLEDAGIVCEFEAIAPAANE
ncbi:hypothetical protein [Echinimonas agarilytica]|uniref:Uncharacterized protein n=1 Tax=Echinimonas agarilytica TaxID=1215918 RepID=A0AA42B9D7_9GAMM|nr:hypothetical protein [Echinimonas agarilytica]MCM2681041.1 hypothetical protein [Echinimonas agarilytica]